MPVPVQTGLAPFDPMHDPGMREFMYFTYGGGLPGSGGDNPLPGGGVDNILGNRGPGRGQRGGDTNAGGPSAGNSVSVADPANPQGYIDFGPVSLSPADLFSIGPAMSGAIGVTDAMQELGVLGVIGPEAPAVGTPEFHAVTNAIANHQAMSPNSSSVGPGGMTEGGGTPGGGGSVGGSVGAAGSGSPAGGGSGSTGSSGVGSGQGGAPGGNPGEGGGGGGDGGDGKVICGELYYQGYLPLEIYAADLAYHRLHATAATVRAYHAWAVPYVRLMRRSRLATVAVLPFARTWAYQMAYEMGVTDRPSRFGRVFTGALTRLHEVAGRLMAKRAPRRGTAPFAKEVPHG